MPNELLDHIRRYAADIPCVRALQLEPLELSPGIARIRARNNPAWNGLRPGVHGGVLSYIADCVAWFAIVAREGPEIPLVTTDLALRYLGPCRTDEVIATGRVIKFGRTLCPVAVELSDADGVVSAVGQVCYMRLDGPVK